MSSIVHSLPADSSGLALPAWPRQRSWRTAIESSLEEIRSPVVAMGSFANLHQGLGSAEAVPVLAADLLPLLNGFLEKPVAHSVTSRFKLLVAGMIASLRALSDRVEPGLGRYGDYSRASSGLVCLTKSFDFLEMPEEGQAVFQSLTGRSVEEWIEDKAGNLPDLLGNFCHFPS